MQTNHFILMYTNTKKSTESYTKRICHRKNYQKEKWILRYQVKIKKYNIVSWEIQQDFIHSVYGREQRGCRQGGGQYI